MPVRIGYQNLLAAATITASGEATGFPKENGVDGIARDWWKAAASGTQWLQFDLGAATSIDYLYLYSFNLQGGQIALQWSADGSTGWTDIIAAFTPASDVVFKSFTSVSKRYLRLYITGSTAAPQIGCASVGAMLEYARGPQVGFAPVLFQPAVGGVNETEGGYPVGSDYKLVAEDILIRFDTLSPSLTRSDWLPFFEHAKTGSPFVVSWDEVNYPNEASFCRCDPKSVKQAPYSHTAFQKYELRGKALVVS